MGAISKKGNSLMRYLLVEASQIAVKFDPELRRDYQRLKFRRGHSGVFDAVQWCQCDNTSRSGQRMM